MKNQLLPILLLVFSLTLVVQMDWAPASSPTSDPVSRYENMHLPSEHFFLQRSYPDPVFDVRAYEAAMKQALRQDARSTRSTGNSWTTQGPGNIGGRMNVVTIHPTNPNIIYTGSAAGGVHKTTDGGQSWVPIFDDFAYLSIGAITLDPSDPNTIYVGTGDPNISGYPFIGDGVYKSTDGGQSWTHLGLTDARIISRIIVHPTNPQLIFASGMGLPFERNNDRGLYRSQDGGQTWTQVLFLSNQAGIIDMVMDPFNPDVLYASGWDRIRNNQESLVSGMNATVWKTTDGGTNWSLVSNNNGFPSLPQGRIGLTISQQTPNLLYALVVGTNSQTQGVYRSTDGGQNWVNVLTGISPNALGGFGWYFGQIRINPQDDSELWILGVDLYSSQDSGSTFSLTGPPWWNYTFHADKHDLQFDSNNDIYVATDGGLYKSSNGGLTFVDIENIANTQFYRVALNPHQTGTYYGGAQDNGSTGGNVSSFNNWPRIYGGDGFQMRFDPSNVNTFYAETQNGNLVATTDGGNNFFNHTNGIAGGDRRNWDMPFVLSSFDPDRQYTGTYRVYRNTAGAGGLWQPISPDLTDGVIFGNAYHTISTVNESAIDGNVLWAGTTDGNVWSSNDYGVNWTNVTGNLPDRYVTSVKPSPLKPNTSFVAHSGYKYNDFFPHIHRTDDLGQSWTDISGDLPNLAINDIYVYPDDDLILFVATDGGVYYTLDGGLDWERVGDNMPMIPVYDLEIERIPGAETLVAGTFARSIMTIELGALFPPLAPTISYSGALTFCEGDSLVLQAPVGFEGYLWSTGDSTQSIVVDESGFYQVSVVNSYGLSSPFSDSIEVIVSPYPSAPIIEASGQLCQGESIVINGPIGFSNYYWSTGEQGVDSIVVSNPGSYSLLVENPGGCSSPLSEWLNVEVTPIPIADFLAEPQFSTEVIFTNQSQDGATYAWNFGDGNTSTEENPIHNYAASGGYEVELIVSNDCGSDTSYQTVNVAISSLDASWLQTVRVFPNPASGQFQIQGEDFDNQAVQLTLMDLSGKQIWKNTLQVSGGRLTHAATVEGLANGVYLLRIQQGEVSATQKITVRR